METLPSNSRRLSADSILSSENLITDPNALKLQDPSLPFGTSLEAIQCQLWPRPQRLTLHSGQPLVLSEELPILFLPPAGYNSSGDVPSLMETWARFKECFCDLGYKLVFTYRTATVGGIVCTINRDLFEREESYVLSVTQTGLCLTASDISGMNFGIGTLIQLLGIFKNKSEIPQLQVNDWPSFKHRAFLVDISAGSAKVPTLEALRNLVEMWSKMKINQLYIHCKLEVTPDWQIPFSPMEMLQLESFCNDRSVSLVPFLDLVPQSTESSVLDLISTIKVYLQAFTKIRYVALGARLVSSLTCGVRRLEDVLPFDLCKLTLILPSSFVDSARTLFQLQAVSMVDSVLLKDSTLSSKCCFKCLVFNPVEQSSLCGFSDHTISSVWEAIKKSSEERYLGVVVSAGTSCRWTTPIAYLAPTTLALGLTWNNNGHMPLRENLSCQLNEHVLQDSSGALGQVLIDLGKVESQAPILWRLLEDPDSTDIENYTPHTFQRVIRQLLSHQSQVQKAELRCSRSGEIVAEVQFIIDLLIFAARIGKSLVSVGTNPNSSYGVSVINVGITNLPSTARTDLANKLLGLIEQFHSIWLNGHLQQNLEAILFQLTKLLNLLVPPENLNDY